MNVQKFNKHDRDDTIINYDDDDLPQIKAELSSVVVSMAKHPETLINLLKSLGSISDEVILILDNIKLENTTIFNEYTTTVVSLPGKGSLEAYSKDVLYYCTKDWILRVDDDETLSADFTRDVIQYYISDRQVTSYWIPRRWYINDLEYICTKPWYPDYQLRLYRNLPAIITLPENIHEPLKVYGKSGKINEIHLKHNDLVIASRNAREKKIERYELMNPGHSTKMFYLYEDYLHDTNVDKEYAENDINDFIISYAPDKMFANLAYSIDVIVRTDNDYIAKTLNCNNVYISYHWFNEDMSIYQWDNERSNINQRNVKTKHKEFTSIIILKTPKVPGVYYLQVDIVEEGKQWFVDSGLLLTETKRIEVVHATQ
ncbi:MAG: hypothetical protein FWD38_00775 [Oscillospiraceae bacterium]|nr:hypothetical protein [Oscillospiraceae bacterium]